MHVRKYKMHIAKWKKWWVVAEQRENYVVIGLIYINDEKQIIKGKRLILNK